MTNKTLDYYNKNSEAFIQGTISADLKDMQNKFLKELNGTKILDLVEIQNVLLKLAMMLMRLMVL